MRGATAQKFTSLGGIKNFYSHAPCGARQRGIRSWEWNRYFYSHAPCGARPAHWRPQPVHLDFYSHASCEARHLRNGILCLWIPFLLTRLLRGATNNIRNNMVALEISTHTPLARRDDAKMRQTSLSYHFYSHASCEARLLLSLVIILEIRISTHTPLARRDLAGTPCQFCPPISTHTPLARRDLHTRNDIRFQVNFYSHASCEARLCTSEMRSSYPQFLLTRLLRGATSA